MMKFDYLEPRSLSEACSMLSEHEGETKILAGGQSLVPLIKNKLVSPHYLIDIKNLSELDYITQDGNVIRLGALATHRAVETSALVKRRIPVLVEMESVLGSIHIRNWGTIGGAVCHADPAGDPAPPLIVLKATVKVMSHRGIREIPLDEFFVDYYETAIKPDEILTEIQIPCPVPGTGMVYLKESVRLGDHPFISTAVALSVDKDVVKEIRVALGAAGNKPIKAIKTEKCIEGKVVTEKVLEEAGERVITEIDPTTDTMGSSEYKKEMAKVILKKAIRGALGRVNELLI